jgi:hypothetical protein
VPEVVVHAFDLDDENEADESCSCDINVILLVGCVDKFL